MRQAAAQDREAECQVEERQLQHQEARDQEVQEDCSRAVLVPWVDRPGEEDRTGRSSWQACGSSLSHS